MNDSKKMEDLLDSLRVKYLSNLPEKLDNLENLVMDLDKESTPEETKKELYRHIHRMKGSAGSYGHQFISTVCHYWEDMMESMRLQKILQDDITDRYLKFVDLLRTYQSNPAVDVQVLENNLVHIADPDKQFNKRALILENSNMIAKVLAATLNEKGYHTSFANDGYVAICRLLNEKFDILFTSLQTSTIDGASLINSLRVMKSPNEDISAALITSSEFGGFSIIHDQNHILHKEDNLLGQISELIS